jgi:esterase/lipase
MATLPQRSHNDWLNAVCQAVQTLRAAHTPVLLAGNSLGGALALWAAAHLARRSTPVDGLILFAPFWRIDHPLWHMLPVIKRAFPTIKPFKLVKPDFNRQETRDGVRNFMPDVNLDDPAVREAITEFELPIGMFNEIRHAGEQAYRSLHHVHAPALVLQGTQDNLVRPAATRRLLVRLRGRVQYVEVPAEHDLTTLKSPAFAQVGTAAVPPPLRRNSTARRHGGTRRNVRRGGTARGARGNRLERPRAGRVAGRRNPPVRRHTAPRAA